MLSMLKKDLNRINDNASDEDIMMEATATSSIRDAVLDDIGFQLIGAENDPQVEKQINNIPEYEEEKELLTMESVELDALLDQIPDTEF